jgi:hypothetical protein
MPTNDYTVKIKVHATRAKASRLIGSRVREFVAQTFGLPVGFMQIDERLIPDLILMMMTEIAFFGKHLPPAPPQTDYQLLNLGDEGLYYEIIRHGPSMIRRVVLRCYCGATLEFEFINQHEFDDLEDFVGAGDWPRPHSQHAFASLHDVECFACGKLVHADPRMSGYILCLYPLNQRKTDDRKA